MANEPVEKIEEPKTEEKPDPLVEKDKELAAARADLSKAQSLLLDPAYQEWLAAKAGDKAARAIERKAEKAEKDKENEVDYSKLSPKQFKDLLKQELREEMKAELEARVVPVEQTAAVEKAVAQVKECRAKYDDFDEYKDDMMRIAQEYPTITAEKAYKLAKAENPTKAEAFTKKKAAAAETPNSLDSTKIVRQPTEKGFPTAFKAAWKKSFGNAEVTH